MRLQIAADIRIATSQLLVYRALRRRARSVSGIYLIFLSEIGFLSSVIGYLDDENTLFRKRKTHGDKTILSGKAHFRRYNWLKQFAL